MHYKGNSVYIQYSFSGNCAASAPISTFMCLWAIYIFPWSVHIFPPAETAAPSWEYIIRSQTHECKNWDWGPDIPFLGIFASNFRHFFFAVWNVEGPKLKQCNVKLWSFEYSSIEGWRLRRWSITAWIFAELMGWKVMKCWSVKVLGQLRACKVKELKRWSFEKLKFWSFEMGRR
jgi:hypothetical protein